MARVKVNRVKPNPHTDEDFIVSIASDVDDNTKIISSYNSYKQIENYIKRDALLAFNEYDPTGKRYSVYTSDKSADSSTLTLDRLAELGDNPQTNLTSILEINNLVRFYINTDDIIGRTYESIETNVNTEYSLSYGDKTIEGTKRKKKSLSTAKSTITAFNEQINIESLIRDTIPLSYAEGTRILYLRNVDDGYVVDVFPLGIAIIADYTINSKPVVYIDIKELENRLRKTYLKNKNGKALFFENIEKEIKANYPDEVHKAYKNKESYAVLDNTRTGIIRVNNLGRKYGVSPIFRALKPTLMLEQFANSDNVNAKARVKKILFQKMRKEAMGPSYDKKAWEDMSYAHKNLVQAFSQSTVLYTAIPQVEDVKYVEPNTEMTSIDTINAYRSRTMVTLGVNFLNTESGQTVTTANISINQLLLTINKISEQLERVLMDWYKLVLDEQGVGYEYAPSINIIDSEQLSMDIKKSLVELVFSKLNGSYQTAYELLGIDVEDEKARREAENEAGYDTVFVPHSSQYTKSGDSGSDGEEDDSGGRPASDEPNDKQDYDEEYTENVRT